MVEKLDAIKIYEIAESGNTRNLRGDASVDEHWLSRGGGGGKMEGVMLKHFWK